MFYWRALNELNSDRPPSFTGMAPIPLGSILIYADFLGLTHEETEWFVRVIRTVDNRKCVLVADAQAKRNKPTT